eukprot:COSAG02_NODE_926_length_15856_cov_13.975566_15_plen_66_part_00
MPAAGGRFISYTMDLLLFAAVLAMPAVAPRPARTKPNIVMLFVDVRTVRHRLIAMSNVVVLVLQW